MKTENQQTAGQQAENATGYGSIVVNGDENNVELCQVKFKDT